MQGIYKITNTINGKCYIGQSVDIKRRWRHHKNPDENEKKYPLYRAIKKYGIDNFNFEVIEIVEDKDILTEKEEFWYNYYLPDYNQMKPRRANSVLNKQVYQIELKTLKVIDVFLSINDASRKTGITHSLISRCCTNKARTAGGYHWCFVKNYSEEWRPYKEIKKVIQYSKDKKIINVFENVRQAEKELNIKNIRRALKGDSKTAGGYYWRYEKDNKNK